MVEGVYLIYATSGHIIQKGFLSVFMCRNVGSIQSRLKESWDFLKCKLAVN